MKAEPCHAEVVSPREAARQVILQLGIKRVADWCGLSVFAIYKWFERKSDDEPVPPTHVAAIVRGARADGIEVDPRVLWPAMPVAA